MYAGERPVGEGTTSVTGAGDGQLEGFGGTSNGTVRMETGFPETAPPVNETPGLTGAWLWLFGALLAATSVFVIRRQARGTA